MIPSLSTEECRDRIVAFLHTRPGWTPTAEIAALLAPFGLNLGHVDTDLRHLRLEGFIVRRRSTEVVSFAKSGGTLGAYEYQLTEPAKAHRLMLFLKKGAEYLQRPPASSQKE